MKMLTPRGVWTLGLLLALTSLTCAKGTYLEVQFTGTGLPEIRSIAVDLTLTETDGGVVRSHDVIKPGGPIALPATMAFKLDSENGTLSVAATALGAQDQEVATASKTTTIMHGQTWTIVLKFGPSAAALTTDVVVDAGGT